MDKYWEHVEWRAEWGLRDEAIRKALLPDYRKLRIGWAGFVIGITLDAMPGLKHLFTPWCFACYLIGTVLVLASWRFIIVERRKAHRRVEAMLFPPSSPRGATTDLGNLPSLKGWKGGETRADPKRRER